MLSAARRLSMSWRVFLVAVVGVGVVVLWPIAAHAELCKVDTGGGTFNFVDCDTLDGDDGDNGSTGSTGSTCEIGPGDNPCYEGESCLINDPAKVDLELITDDLGPKPGDEDHPAFRSCGADYLWYWSKDGEPSVQDLALMAFGNLPFPDFAPVFSPPGRTLVNLQTWWWADGATTADLTASAGSVTVTASPNRMEVDPGDGSAVIVCAFTTTRSDECTHVYRRSAANGYTARQRLSWDVTFADADAPITLAGLPTGFTSPWGSVNVPVREVQTRVVPR